jgi:hypothetical protein
MRSGTFLFAFALGLAAAVWLLPVGACFAQEASPATDGTSAAQADAAYRAVVDDAVTEFSAGRFEEARALFQRAHELSPNARSLRGLGMTAFELRSYVQAISELRAALADQRKPLTGELRRNAQELIEKARKFVGAIRIVKEPQSASVLIDGKPFKPQPDGSLLLDAGTHVVAATAPEHKTSNVRVLVEGGSEQTVYVTLESLKIQQSMIAPIDAQEIASRPASREEPVQPVVAPATSAPEQDTSVRTWAIGTLIGAGVFGSTAAIFWLLGNGQESELEMSCAPSCSDMQLDDSGLRTSDLLTNVFLGLGAASAVASGVLFIVAATGSDEAAPSSTSGSASTTSGSASRASHPVRPRAALRIGPLGASVTGSF